MRRYMKALLLMCVALLYAGTAGAYSISVVESTPLLYASDTITVDVWVESGGKEVYGWTFWVVNDPGQLSPNGGTLHAMPNEDDGSLYLYPSGDAWYIKQISYAGAPSVDQSVATLVFHVVEDIPATTNLIAPVFSFGGYDGNFVGENSLDVTGEVVLNALHVPEPTTTMLLGLGLLGILYAGRRR